MTLGRKAVLVLLATSAAIAQPYAADPYIPQPPYCPVRWPDAPVCTVSSAGGRCTVIDAVLVEQRRWTCAYKGVKKEVLYSGSEIITDSNWTGVKPRR